MSSIQLKIKKAKGGVPDDFEATVAQALVDLETSSDLKADLSQLHIVKASEMDLTGGRKAVVIFVPFKQLKDYHKVQARLIRELEKKFRFVDHTRTLTFICTDTNMTLTFVSFLIELFIVFATQRPSRNFRCPAHHSCSYLQPQAGLYQEGRKEERPLSLSDTHLCSGVYFGGHCLPYGDCWQAHSFQARWQQDT